MALLERTHQRHPTDREALRYAREIAALYPADPQVRKLVSDLEERHGH
jgi:hypothetical protein